MSLGAILPKSFIRSLFLKDYESVGGLLECWCFWFSRSMSSKESSLRISDFGHWLLYSLREKSNSLLPIYTEMHTTELLLHIYREMLYKSFSISLNFKSSIYLWLSTLLSFSLVWVLIKGISLWLIWCFPNLCYGCFFKFSDPVLWILMSWLLF